MVPGEDPVASGEVRLETGETVCVVSRTAVASRAEVRPTQPRQQRAILAARTTPGRHSISGSDPLTDSYSAQSPVTSYDGSLHY